MTDDLDEALAAALVAEATSTCHRARRQRRGRLRRARRRGVSCPTSSPTSRAAHDAVFGYCPVELSLRGVAARSRNSTRPASPTRRGARWRSQVAGDAGSSRRPAPSSSRTATTCACRLSGRCPGRLRDRRLRRALPAAFVLPGNRAVPLGRPERRDRPTSPSSTVSWSQMSFRPEVDVLDLARRPPRGTAGPAGAELLARPRRALGVRRRGQRSRRRRTARGAGGFHPRPLRLRRDDASSHRYRGHGRRVERHLRLADPRRPLARRPRAPTSSPSTPAERVTPATCSRQASRSSPTAPSRPVNGCARGLDADSGLGVLRYADAGYSQAMSAASSCRPRTARTSRRTGNDARADTEPTPSMPSGAVRCSPAAAEDGSITA